jgi:hypothetical protein
VGYAGGRDSPVVQFGGGVLASLVQSTVTVPVEVVRQRQMVQTAGEGSYTVKLLSSRFLAANRVGGFESEAKEGKSRLHMFIGCAPVHFV